MYSSKENVNILTALLCQFGIRHAVVCPGSRNAPIVHNLNECPDIRCHPVTDERSAGFFALGIAQATDAPVVVCVTSGSALLNLAPAVAEAKYQHQSLIVVSADRPAAWIDQLDGQTLPQPGALGGLVDRSVSLPECGDDESRWFCNRLVNEALLETERPHRPCIHINVPISEPLFVFGTPQLPRERKMVRIWPATDYEGLHADIIDGLLQSRRPMIVFGQTNPHHFAGDGVDFLFSHVIVLHEALSNFPSISHFDEVLCGLESEQQEAEDLLPDFVIYVGDAIVSKRLKRFLRQAREAVVWRISPSGAMEDTFQNLHGTIVGDPEFVLQALNDKLRNKKANGADYRRQWLQRLTRACRHAEQYTPAYSQLAAVRCFEQQLRGLPGPCHVHYANSTAVRLANLYAAHHVWCNRGVNGIEGSLSTAAGFSAVCQEPVFCVIGDLSFFYDGNALWNQNLPGGADNGQPVCGGLRILLLNNGRGGIFNLLRGLEQSPARDRLVAAEHDRTAEGVCLQNHIGYQAVRGAEELSAGISWLLAADATGTRLLEVQTDAEADEQAFKDYYRHYRENK